MCAFPLKEDSSSAIIVTDAGGVYKNLYEIRPGESEPVFRGAYLPTETIDSEIVAFYLDEEEGYGF